MDLRDFIKAYSELRSEDMKQGQIRKIIKRTYCPVKEKIEFLKDIKVKSITESGLDLCLNKIYFTVGLIELYTKLDLNSNDIDIFEYYDLLIQNKIIDIVIGNVGNDIEELLSFNGVILDM